MILLKSFCLGAVIGLIVALGLLFGHPPIADTINASSMPWLATSMLLMSFAGLFGVVYLTTPLGNAEASGRPSATAWRPPNGSTAMALGRVRPVDRRVGRLHQADEMRKGSHFHVDMAAAGELQLNAAE